MKKNKTDVKMRFYTGIALVALFNTIFTSIKPYIPHIKYEKGPKHAMRVLKRTGRKRILTSLNPHDEFLITLMRSRLRLLNEGIADHFDTSPTKSSFIFQEELLLHFCNFKVFPGAMTKSQMTKKEVQETKEIANLRIHVERAINRIKNYRKRNIARY